MIRYFKYSACADLLGRNDIGTIDELKSFIEKSKSEMDVLSQERDKIYNRLRRASDPELIKELKESREALTKQIGYIRKNLKTADFTLDRSAKIVADIQIEQKYCCGVHMKYRVRARSDRDRER